MQITNTLKAWTVSFTITSLLAACGKSTTPATGVNLVTNPLAGASAASLPRRLFDSVLGIPSALAAVSSFSTLKVCVGEVTFELMSGSPAASPKPLKPGLLDFNPTSTEPLVIGNLDLPASSSLKKIKFTIETVPSLCQNAQYAVLFNAGDGDHAITQNTAFEFDFEAGGKVVSPGDTVTLYLGAIVDSMVLKGNSLNNETIQTLEVGQAK